MIDKKKKYTLGELIDIFNMYDLAFKYYGNNDNGELEFYMKTDASQVSVFTSIDKMSKYDYINLNEEEAKKVKFKFDREVSELELDIVAIVLKTSDVNIPAGRYSLKKLDELTKIQYQEEREKSELEDGITYIIVDNNTACSLYDGLYIFNKDNKGLIEDLKEKKEIEKEELHKNNLDLILNYYDDILEKEKTL